jgi:hypothetical protein
MDLIVTSPNSIPASVDLIEQQLRKFQKELSAGTVSLAMLSVLAAAPAPMYGYQIAKTLERRAPCIRSCAIWKAPGCWKARSSPQPQGRRAAITASPHPAGRS